MHNLQNNTTLFYICTVPHHKEGRKVIMEKKTRQDLLCERTINLIKLNFTHESLDIFSVIRKLRYEC